jgi:hypothetical protein
MSLTVNEKIARYLVKKNIRNIKNPITLNTLIHYLCKNDENSPLLQLIKPNKKEIEEKNILGQTLLNIAVENKSYKLIKYLIENNANLLSKDNKKNTPLHIAVKNADYNIIQLFMKYNLNLNLLNNDEETPLDIAKKKNDKRIIKLLSNNPIEKYNTSKDAISKSIDKKISYRQKKIERSYRVMLDKNNKSNIYNSSVNNCSLDTKNETDNQSFNIYRKKIVSKDSKLFGEKKIKCYKTFSLNMKYKKINTIDKNCSNNIQSELSPIAYRTRFVYRKATPKRINKNYLLLEFEKESNYLDHEYNLRLFSPKAKGNYTNISSFSIKKEQNNIINNKSSIIKEKKYKPKKFEYCEDITNPMKIIQYDKLKNNKIKAKKNNRSPISLKNTENNNCKIKKVRNTLINITPFVNFKKLKKKKKDLSKEKLLNFLKEIGMQHYGNILISEGFDDFNLILNQMKDGFPKLDDSLKEIGIKSPGDRAKILIRIQQVSVKFGFEFPFEQVFFKNNGSIQKWLNKEKLQKYINNFINAGYQSLELLLIQMASKFKMNDEILKNDIHINNEEDRKIILKSLEENSLKYTYELTKRKNIQRTYSKMVQNDSESFCNIT